MAEEGKKRGGRPKLPDAKSELITVRVTRTMKRDIEDARGVTPRTVWVEDAIAAKLAGPGATESETATKRCLHPANRMIGTFCGECQQDIE